MYRCICIYAYIYIYIYTHHYHFCYALFALGQSKATKFKIIPGSHPDYTPNLPAKIIPARIC